MKFKSYDEAKELLTSSKEEMEIARTEFKAYRKEKGIAKDEEPTDAKVLKHYNKLLKTKTDKEKVVDEIREYLKENKPKKEAKPRVTKYEYPAECTTISDKKKFRASKRAEAKRAEKEKNGEGKKTKKEDKKSDKKKDSGKKEEKSGKSEKKGEKSSKKDKGEKKEKEEKPED